MLPCMYETLPIDRHPAYSSQMSEEIDNAALNVPRAIFTTMVINGATGFGMVLAVMFCLGDIETVLVIDPNFKQRNPIDFCAEYTYRIPLHTGLLSRHRVEGRSDRNGQFNRNPSHVRRHWIPRHRIPNDMVIRPRPRHAILSIHQQSKSTPIPIPISTSSPSIPHY